jgi:hypothetical protein
MMDCPIHQGKSDVRVGVGGYMVRSRPAIRRRTKEKPMSDDKKRTGKPDRDRVSAHETYEVENIAKKYALPPPLVKKVIEQEGPMRKDIEKYLEKMKK